MITNCLILCFKFLKYIFFYLATEVNNLSSRAVHVVTPLPSATSMSGLTPIVVPQGGQNGTTNLAHILTSPQLAGKVRNYLPQCSSNLFKF